MKKVSLVGLGYIGLPTALIAANNGLVVQGYDLDKKKIDLLNKGISPIIEPGIQNLLTKTKNFSASTTLEPADYFIIAVPTPFEQVTLEQETPNKRSAEQAKRADLSYVFNAGQAIARKLRPGNTIILESTVPVGTTQKLAQRIEKDSGLKASKDFYLAYCPERVLPGKIINELISNDRIVGGICEQSAKIAKQFYDQFVAGSCYLTTDKTAEMIKLVENSSRDIQIALANQIGAMCAEAKVNPFEVIKLANKHPRVSLLQPGCGVGGHCIAVDPWFLIESFPENSQLLQTARKINDGKPHLVIETVVSCAKNFVAQHKRLPKILALGLTFKPNVDDLRESPALQIAQDLAEREDLLTLRVYDPFVCQKAIASFRLSSGKNLETELGSADIIVALVKHSCFETIAQKDLTNKKLIDPCGTFIKTRKATCEQDIYKTDQHGATFFKKGERPAFTRTNPTNRTK